MMRQLTRTLIASFALVGLSACATAPRGEAARISEVGVKATGTFQTDTNALADQLAAGSVTEAFAQRWQVCKSQFTCNVAIPPDANAAARAKLAATVRLRAVALGALGDAYAALGQEADYDAREDLKSATNDAVGAVNDFAGAAFAGAGSAIPAPVLGLIGEAAGIFADSRQRGRILNANAKLGELTRRFHDALTKEKFVFDSLADATELRRSEARIALFEAGLVPGSDILRPMAEALGMTLNGGADSQIQQSDALRRAVVDVARAQSAVETQRIKSRYATALAALQALIVEHGKLGTGSGISLAEVDRLLAAINASLDLDKETTAAPKAASGGRR